MLRQGPTDFSVPHLPTARVVQQAGTPAQPSTVIDYRDVRIPIVSPASYEKLTLPLFVARFNNSLPVVVRVCRGFCGPNEETSISEGDRFNVHFVKHTTVVAVECENGSQYKVPLNSAIPFGIMYDPHNNENEALRGYRYEKVSDLIQADPLPRVVRARRAHTGSNPDNSLVANELLIVRRVTKKLRKKELRVLSLTAGREKVLGEAVKGEFSTKPREVCLYLPELLKHVQDLFPHKAVLYGITGGAAHNSIQSKLSASVIKLMHSSIETSLVATSANSVEPENSRLLDIPVDLDILVRVVSFEENDANKKLYEDTHYIYSHFDPSRLNPYVKSSGNSTYDTQSLLYTTVRWGQDTKGVEIVKPASVATTPPGQSPPVPRARSKSLDKESGEEKSECYHRVQRQYSSPMAIAGAGSVRNRPLPPAPFSHSPPVSSSPIGSSPIGSSPSDSSPSSFPTALQKMPTMGAIPEDQQTHALNPPRQRTPGYSYVDTFPMRCTVEGPGANGDGGTPANPLCAEKTITDGSAGAVVCKRESKDLDAVLDDLQQQISDMDSLSDYDNLNPLYAYDVPSNRPAYEKSSTRGSQSSKQSSEEQDGSLTEAGCLERSCEESKPDETKSCDSFRLEETGHEGEASVEQIKERNRLQLKKLDCLQIHKLLDAMGLPQYQDGFAQQQINGDILSDIDEDILKNELHISSRLHRMRFMKVISGQYSVAQIMAGGDGYIVMQSAK